MSLPKIAVVVLVYNGEQIIEKCLESVFKSDYQGPMEVIVVDNASTDESWKSASRRFGLRNPGPMVIGFDPKPNGNGTIDYKMYHLDKNLGWAGGNNYGISRAGNDWDLALFLNDDVELRPDTISELVKASHTPGYRGTQSTTIAGKVGVFGCKLLYPNGKIQHLGAAIKPTGHTCHYIVDHPDVSFRPHYVTGAAIMITRECWEACGKFPECYHMYYEEAEYCLRARKKGYETICVPSAVAIHYADQREGRSKYTFYLNYERSRLRFVWRNYTFCQLLKWFKDEWRWYRANISGQQNDHANAICRIYKEMWYRLPWIGITRRSS
jgi:GT2 family glycosyltransferase